MYGQSLIYYCLLVLPSKCIIQALVPYFGIVMELNSESHVHVMRAPFQSNHGHLRRHAFTKIQIMKRSANEDAVSPSVNSWTSATYHLYPLFR